MLKSIPIDQITRRADARALNEASVASLVDSIGSVGLINPIRVREKGGRWEVTAGSHRLAACERLGLADIECIVVSDDDLHSELAMIDENLCRNELSPAERASQTARRKVIYEEMHGPAKANSARAANASMGREVDVTENFSFTSDTARATNQSERVVQLNVERGTKVIPEVIGMISGTKLDTGAYLDKLKRLNPNEQVAAARRDLADLRRQQRPVKRAPAPQNPEDVKEAQIAALMNAWNKAGQDARDEFLSRIDFPVFGRQSRSEAAGIAGEAAALPSSLPEREQA